MEHDAEFAAYQRVKEAKLQGKIPIDNGMRYHHEDPQVKQKRLAAKAVKTAKKALQASNRGALNSSNMLYHDDEKFIQQYYRSKFIAKVMAEKNEVSITDELIIDLLSYACVRVFRKSRLESMFGRFMDRTAPQDPVAQILNCIKSLGLKSNLKGTESGKETLSKLLGSDAEEMNVQNAVLSFEQWQEAERTKGGMRIERRADTDFAVNGNFYKIGSDIKEPDTDDNSITVKLPDFK